MGRIHILIEGSFPGSPLKIEEDAQFGGHAAALGRAIEKLGHLLPMAIRKDHDCHDQGVIPGEAPWGHREPDG